MTTSPHSPDPSSDLPPGFVSPSGRSAQDTPAPPPAPGPNLPFGPIIGGVAAVLVIGLAVAAFLLFTGGEQSQPAAGDPEQVARATVAEIGKLDRGEVDNVADIVCAERRDSFRDQFGQVREAFAALRRAASQDGTSLDEINPTFRLGKVTTDGDTGTFEIRYEATFGGETAKDLMTGSLIREGNAWKVCAIG